MKRYALAAGAAVMFTLLVACGSSEPAAPASGGIVMSGNAYSGSLTVKTGQQVTVRNEDPTEHTLTDQTTLARQVPAARTPPGPTPSGQKTAMFSTGTIQAGGTATFTAPAEPGSYPFGCRIHLTMRGTLTVQGGT